MPATPIDPLLGVHLTAVTVADLTLTAGVWVAGTAVSILAYIKSVEDEEDIETVDIRPVNRPLKNLVPTSWGEGVRLQVIQRSADVTALTELWRASVSKRFEITWAAGMEGDTGRYTAMSRRGGVSSNGENTADFTFGPMDDGSHDAQTPPSNVTYTNLGS